MALPFEGSGQHKSGAHFNILEGSISSPYIDHKPNSVNQDSLASYCTDEYAIISVADGAGSLMRSDEGSNFAVRESVKIATNFFHEQSDESITITSEEIAAKTIRKVYENFKNQDFFREGGCTLTIAVMNLVAKDFSIVVLGDSFGVIEYTNGFLDFVQSPQNGEYTNQTRLLSSSDAEIAQLSGDLTTIKTIVLCSDGFEHATIENGSPVHGFWSNIFKILRKDELNIENLIQFMISKNRIDDDTTMLILENIKNRNNNDEDIDHGLHSVWSIHDLPEFPRYISDDSK